MIQNLFAIQMSSTLWAYWGQPDFHNEYKAVDHMVHSGGPESHKVQVLTYDAARLRKPSEGWYYLEPENRVEI